MGDNEITRLVERSEHVVTRVADMSDNTLKACEIQANGKVEEARQQFAVPARYKTINAAIAGVVTIIALAYRLIPMEQFSTVVIVVGAVAVVAMFKDPIMALLKRGQ